MISVAEANNIVLQHAIDFGVESIPLSECAGRVLREDLIADRDFPPFDRITMDGIAIQYDHYAQGQTRFPIQEVAAAGRPRVRLREASNCIEVMTGAILPEGCDTVIRYEDLNVTGNIVEIVLPSLERGKNIHKQGTDRRKGERIVHHGARIQAPEVGVAATVGKPSVKVNKLPRVVIVSTGDELVPIDAHPESHQIRQSNIYQVRTLLQNMGVACELAHLPDKKEMVIKGLENLLEENDCLILSGGVSAGKFDYVPDSLEAIGVNRLFHKVAQRPGKPFWFGVSDNNKVVFALPGNPVSSFMCTVRYVLPWIDACQGIDREPYYALLAGEFRFKPPLTYFLQVKLNFGNDGVCHATPVEGHGSGDLANLVKADGFLELEAGREVFSSGERFPCYPFRW